MQKKKDKNGDDRAAAVKTVCIHNRTNLPDPDLDTKLIEASKQGHVDCIRTLIRAGGDVNRGDVNRYRTRRAGGKTALVHAAENGPSPMCRGSA